MEGGNGCQDSDRQIWEVICPKGVFVRIARELNSPSFDERLSSGSLVQQVTLTGDRLRYHRIAGTGNGPDSGWVSVRARGAELLAPVDIDPPNGGWKILKRELSTSWVGWKGPSLPVSPGTEFDAGNGSVARSQCQQRSGEPYVFYRRVFFNDTKPTGLRMSACLAAMDEARTDTCALNDHTVRSMAKVTSPITQAVIEFKPAIARLGEATDGLLYADKDAKGPVLSWICDECEFGWPEFPMRREEHTLFYMGKDHNSHQRLPVATARFTVALVDDSQHPPTLLDASQWEQDVNTFFAKLRTGHQTQALAESKNLSSMYPAGTPFVPTQFRQVSWRMAHSFSDTWAVLYHAKVPELLWDLNMLADGYFAKLLTPDADPQSLVMNLPKRMQVGHIYDAYCFLDEKSFKACYLLCPKGKSSPSDCVLSVFASYNWVTESAQGISSHDIRVVETAGIRALFAHIAGSSTKNIGPTGVVDISSLSKS